MRYAQRQVRGRSTVQQVIRSSPAPSCGRADRSRNARLPGRAARRNWGKCRSKAVGSDCFRSLVVGQPAIGDNDLSDGSLDVQTVNIDRVHEICDSGRPTSQFKEHVGRSVVAVDEGQFEKVLDRERYARNVQTGGKCSASRTNVPRLDRHQRVACEFAACEPLHDVA